jgi:hypothetical protein
LGGQSRGKGVERERLARHLQAPRTGLSLIYSLHVCGDEGQRVLCPHARPRRPGAAAAAAAAADAATAVNPAVSCTGRTTEYITDPMKAGEVGTGAAVAGHVKVGARGRLTRSRRPSSRSGREEPRSRRRAPPTRRAGKRWRRRRWKRAAGGAGAANGRVAIGGRLRRGGWRILGGADFGGESRWWPRGTADNTTARAHLPSRVPSPRDREKPCLASPALHVCTCTWRGRGSPRGAPRPGRARTRAHSRTRTLSDLAAPSPRARTRGNSAVGLSGCPRTLLDHAVE